MAGLPAQLSRGTFSEGSSVCKLQVELWGGRSPSPYLGEGRNCQPFAEQRAQVPVAQPGDQTLRDTAGADGSQTFPCLDCKIIKVQGLFC